MPKEAPVRVIFRMLQGESLALFPEIPGDYSAHTCLSYAHTGQHCAADCTAPLGTPATPEQYTPLKKELESLGYVLIIAHRTTRKDYQKRRAALG